MPISVLLLEDDPETREDYEEILTQHGFEVHPAATINEAEAIKSAQMIEILLLDVNLGAGDTSPTWVTSYLKYRANESPTPAYLFFSSERLNKEYDILKQPNMAFTIKPHSDHDGLICQMRAMLLCGFLNHRHTPSYNILRKISEDHFLKEGLDAFVDDFLLTLLADCLANVSCIVFEQEGQSRLVSKHGNLQIKPEDHPIFNAAPTGGPADIHHLPQYYHKLLPGADQGVSFAHFKPNDTTKISIGITKTPSNEKVQHNDPTTLAKWLQRDIDKSLCASFVHLAGKISNLGKGRRIQQ